MSRSWTGLAIVVGLSVVAGCERPAPASGGGQASQDSARAALLLASARVALPPVGVVPAMLPAPGSEGAKLVGQYCTKCHALPLPSSHSTTDWPVVLRRMWLRMELLDTSFAVPKPTPTERMVMVRYMQDNAFMVATSPLPPGPGADLFRTTCSRCHELPDPRQHSASDWATVVTRMRQHMESILRQSPTQAEVQQLVLYLEQASRRR